MPQRIPKYRLHKGSGQALVQINGERIYLGVYDTPESHERYHRLIAEYLSTGQTPTRHSDPADTPALTVNKLILAYFEFALTYYKKDGQPTGEITAIRSAMRRLRELFGATTASEFGPKSFKLVRERMINEGLSRTYVNDSMGRISRMFRWAASEEMLPVTVYQALATVPGLRRYRSQAKETVPVAPVSDAVVESTLPHLPQIVADMVQVQRLTGCRPQEICLMRPADIDRTDDVWCYIPERHKTEHHGRQRAIFFGPKAQEILRPYLLRPAEDHCFSPEESETQRSRIRRERRQTPLRKTTDRKRERPRQRPPGKHYNTASYRRAIHRACEKAGIERWSPNQLRHSAGTEFRRLFGIEAAQVILGHAQADVTQVYAERDLSRARGIMGQIG